MSKSSKFKSPLGPSAATASVPNTSQETESEMEISIASDVTHQPSTTSLLHRPGAVTTTTAEDSVLDQFQQIRLMISIFGVHIRTLTVSPRQLFCNYLHFKIGHLEEQDFLTFRNETGKLISGIQ